MAGREADASGVEPAAAVPSLTLAAITAQAAARHLVVLGGFACEDDPGLPQGTRTLLLLGPQEPGFWPHLTEAPEWQDGAADPVDRWSRRVIGHWACDLVSEGLGAKALFPFGGPPYHPFYSWALRSGRVWQSPVRLLVQAEQGLMVSFRGALALRQAVAVPPALPRPCDACPQPCLAACPVSALTASGYDLHRCHGFLDQPAGADCMGRGCAVRRACPLSQSHARMPEQSAYHMRQFHR